MFSSKNFSPNQLSALTATLLAIINAIVFLLVNNSWKTALFISVITFVISYFIIQVVLEKFIYRKIKLIYKFIHQTKATKREEFYYDYVLPKKGIDDVREDVEKWAMKRSTEIDILKQNEKYRKEFLQNLAHEFKTPIFAIQGYIDILLEEEIDTETEKKYLQNTSKNVERLTNLVNDLDEIISLESGQQRLNYQTFFIQEIIREMFAALSLKANKKQIICSIKKGCEKNIAVFADKEKVKQVLNNLIANAIKYGKNNGIIVASIYNTDDDLVLIEISDDGYGIAEENLNRVFERFYRTDIARSRQVGGSGLGLAICKHIIEAHNQTIHIRSKINVGTTVGFTLNAHE